MGPPAFAFSISRFSVDNHFIDTWTKGLNPAWQMLCKMWRVILKFPLLMHAHSPVDGYNR
jgi:hypothetical protein